MTCAGCDEAINDIRIALSDGRARAWHERCAREQLREIRVIQVGGRPVCPYCGATVEEGQPTFPDADGRHFHRIASPDGDCAAQALTRF
jgi:hypothetical protein